MTTDFLVRRALAADAATLAALGERTFRDTFSAGNRAEDMDVYVALAFGLRQQAAELGDPRVLTLIAESAEPSGRHAIGYATLRQVADETPPCVTGPEPIELARLYVDRPWHGRAVGAALMEHAIDASRERGARTLWLGVWEHNPRARAFYARWGFVEVGEHDFMLGDDLQRDLLLARAI
ncbi:MAG TPA: GNAT family N-acetyltransferase [Gemmatimonadaceae bacterium]|nr:GNAT family N-acetyltransferase [Gemmatimonadaceae bacterium]